MKKVLLTILTSALFATPVFAEPYVSVSTGLGYVANSNVTVSSVTYNDFITYKSGVPFIGAVGYKEDAYRLEFAFGYQSNGVDKFKSDVIILPSVSGSSVAIFSYMLNYYYDINLKNGIAPYITAGIGSSTIRVKGFLNALDSAYVSDSQSMFTYQLGAGIGIKASENIVIDLGYRYFKPAPYTVLDMADISAASSNFLVGARYNF